MPRSHVFIAVFIVLAVTSAVSAAINDPVRLDTGTISGLAGNSPDVRVYKGIPFAAPPVGDLRFRAPQPPAKWEGTRKADQFGPMCMQGGAGGGVRGVLLIEKYFPTNTETVSVFANKGNLTPF